MRYNLKLAEAFHKTDIGLDGILVALGKEPPPPPPPPKDPKITYCYYSNGDIKEYEIIGELSESLFDTTNLTCIEAGNTVTTIPQRGFYYSDDLKSLLLQNSNIKSIGDYAFYDQTLETIVFPKNSLTSIGGDAFGYTNLTAIEIPGSVKSIGISTFSNCSNLKTVKLGWGMTEIGRYMFYKCTSLENVEIPATIETIMAGAFGQCINLKSIILPDNVKIVASAFGGCVDLSSITTLKTNIEEFYGISENAFGTKEYEGIYSDDIYAGWNSRETGNNVLRIPENAVGYSTENPWKEPLQNANKCGFHTETIILSSEEKTKVKYSNGSTREFSILNSINGETIYDSYSMVSVDIGTAISSLDYTEGSGGEPAGAFAFCNNLTAISIPNTVEYASEFTFYQCENLSSIALPENLKNIGYYSFLGCPNLSSISCFSKIPPKVSPTVFYDEYEGSVGENTRSLGINRLCIPRDSTGYDSTDWVTTLCDPSKCGFHIEYL